MGERPHEKMWCILVAACYFTMMGWALAEIGGCREGRRGPNAGGGTQLRAAGAGPGGESSFATQQVSGSVRRGRPSSLREAPPRPPPPQVLVRTGAAGPVGRAAVPGALLRLPPQDAPSPTAGRHLLPECHSEGCHGARACVRGWSRGSRPSGGPASLPALQRLEAGHWLGTRPGVSRGPRVPSEDGPFSRSSVTSAVRAAASQGRSETRGRLAPDGRLGPEGRWPPSAAHALCPVWYGGLVLSSLPVTSVLLDECDRSWSLGTGTEVE